jgi:hypothetical protein
MRRTGALTKVLAILGTTLVWLPLLAPIFFSVLFFIRARLLRFDYLMPAELFPVALLGGALLLWAAVRAEVTGLASGATEPVGWWPALVLASVAAYSLALVGAGVGGIGLLRDLLRPGGP